MNILAYLIEAYREWVKSLNCNCRFVEQPWFGLSQFCIGLQLADYAAYLVSLKTQQISKKTGESEIINTHIKSQVPVQNSEENRKNRKAELLGAYVYGLVFMLTNNRRTVFQPHHNPRTVRSTLSLFDRRTVLQPYHTFPYCSGHLVLDFYNSTNLN